MSAESLRGRQFLLCTTMLVAALGGYGRRAYAACVAGTPPNFICSGANNTQQTIAFDDATVTTVPGFSVITGNTSAVEVTGDGALSYTDVNASTLTGSLFGLYLRSNADIAGGNPGSVTVNTNGATTGGFAGIAAINVGSGVMDITTNGDATGTGFSSAGVYGKNFGVDTFITTGAGTTTKGSYGILARHYGAGVLDIRANGDVTGTTVDGIYGRNLNGTDFNVTTGPGTTVTGNLAGIRALNYGSGALDVTANGDVSATVRYGIYARNKATGTDVTVTTGPGTTVTGGLQGIRALNYGTGALTVTANGDVLGTGYIGIYARNSANGTSLDVTSGVGTHVSGNKFGIWAKNYGTGALTVTADGEVAGTTNTGIYALNTGGGTDLTVTTGESSVVAGGFNGIIAQNEGSGALTVTANGETYGGLFEGIFAANSANGTSLSVTTGASSTVTGVSNGMNLRNYGTGALTVTADGDVAGIGNGVGPGLTGIGIYAQNFAGTSLTVTTGASSAISGLNHGIFARNYGTRAMSVTANGATTGETFEGIYARQGASGTSLSVTTGAGSDTTGHRTGIAARNYGTGAMSVIANGDVTGTTVTGIYARNEGTDLGVTTGAGSTTTGYTYGIRALNNGSGALTITANGNVTGQDFVGIQARNSADGTDLTVTSNGTVIGPQFGIRAVNSGTGSTSVTANGDVTSTDAFGIYARNSANGDDVGVTIGDGADVAARSTGIIVRNYGGDLAVTTGIGSTVTGTTYAGILAYNRPTGVNLDVTTGSGSATTGDQFGIRAYNDGSGALTVTANGDVTGTDKIGIEARNGTLDTPAGTDLTVITGAGTTVSGANDGIRARNYGTGALSVTANGDVNSAGAAIRAENRVNGTDLTVTTGAGSTLTGGFGIQARNLGTGALTVTANGDVDGANLGIYARNFGTDLSVTTGPGTAVTSTNLGIQASNHGTGALTVIANGDVTGTGFGGIYVENLASGTNLGVTTGAGTATTGGSFGISAYNHGTGAMSVTANGDVTGTSATSYGIYARNRGAGLDIATGFGSNVTGGDTGISAFNLGTGDMTVALNGDVAGTNDTGAELFNFQFGEDLDVTTGFGSTVSGLGLGLRASNSGSGDTTVTVNGDVASTSGGTALYGVNFSNARDITITTAVGTNVTGSAGIFARSFGTGDMTVRANGDVTGTGSNGIEVRNYAKDVTVNTGTFSTVTGAFYGIRVRNEGTGGLSINANGDVTGGYRHGIFAHNTGTSTGGLEITTGAGSSTTGRVIGIDALNYGTGGLTVAAEGDVTGTTNLGIYARNNAASTGNLAITTGGTVSGANTGIFTRNYGSAALNIIANGDVTGTNAAGVYARNSANGTSLGVTTGAGASTTGGQFGIFAQNYGTGLLSINAEGDVAGNSLDGVYAWQSAAGTGLDVTTGASVTGGRTGIAARNHGSGALSVTANGGATGEGGVGIYARNFAAGTDLTVTTGAGSTTSGPNTGIRVQNDGTGATRVDSNGGASGNFYGIEALNTAAATSLTVTTGAGSDVTGGVHGIRAVNEGTGALSVTANGDVTGTDDAGIYARHANGGPIDVTVSAGATAEGGAAGVHINAGAQNSLTNYGTVRNLDGITGVAIVGGTGSEMVDNFGLVTGDVLLGSGVNAFNNMQGGLFESGADVAIGAGNTLTNEGALAPGGIGSVFTTALTGNFVQTASGQYIVDIEGEDADRVDGSGAATVDGKVRPNYTLASLGSSRQWTVLTATTPIVDNGIKAVSTPVVQFDVIFPTATQMDLVVDVDFAVSGLNRNEAAIANNLTAIFDTGKFAKMNDALNAIAFLPSAGAVANALDQLSPEIYLDTQIGMLFAAQSFTNSLMTCPTYDGAAAFIKEGQCVWVRVAGRSFSQDTTFETLGINETSFQVAGGVQGALGDVWRAGFAGAFEQGRLDTSTNAQSDFDRGHAGAVLKYNPGPLLLAASVSGGWGWYETKRQIAFPGFSSLATSDHNVGYLDGRFRAAYLLTNGAWYAKPLVDLDATRLDLDDVSERASGGVGLKVRGSDETVLSATPALEFGMQFGAQGGTLFRPYVRGGATFFDDPNFALQANFEGSPSGVGPFRIVTQTDDVVAVVAAGIDVVGASGASFRLYYDGRFGETVEANEGGIKASLAF